MCVCGQGVGWTRPCNLLPRTKSRANPAAQQRDPPIESAYKIKNPGIRNEWRDGAGRDWRKGRVRGRKRKASAARHDAAGFCRCVTTSCSCGRFPDDHVCTKSGAQPVHVLGECRRRRGRTPSARAHPHSQPARRAMALGRRVTPPGQTPVHAREGGGRLRARGPTASR